MGLFGDEHCSRSHCSCREMRVRGSAWRDPRGTPEIPKRGLPWDTRGGRWLGGVVVPVMAPGVTAAVAGRDLGVLPLRGPRKRHFLPGWVQQLGNPEPKMVRKGESTALGPQHHLLCLHPKGKPFSRRRGHPGGWICPDGKRVSCETGCPNPASSFLSIPSPFSWLWGQQNPGGMGTGGPSALTHQKHIP